MPPIGMNDWCTNILQKYCATNQKENKREACKQRNLKMSTNGHGKRCRTIDQNVKFLLLRPGKCELRRERWALTIIIEHLTLSHIAHNAKFKPLFFSHLYELLYSLKIHHVRDKLNFQHLWSTSFTHISENERELEKNVPFACVQCLPVQWNTYIR